MLPRALSRRDAATGLALSLVAGVVLGGCAGADRDPRPDDDHRAPSSEARLAKPEDGRVLRILGDGSPSMLDGPAAAHGSSVSRPMALVARSDGDLSGLQGGSSAASQLFTLGAQGRATTAGGSGERAPDAGWSLTMAEVGDDLVVVGRESAVQVLDPASGDVSGSVDLPENLPDAWSAALLPPLGGGEGTRALQYGDRWFSLDLSDPAAPSLTPRRAPVVGAVAAAPVGDGALVLTRGRLVQLGADGTAGKSVPYPRSVLGSGTVTSAVALPGDSIAAGLVVTVADPPRGDQGYLVRIQAAEQGGAALRLVEGARPPGTGSDCDDADTPADDAHLTLPTSVAVWQDRIVVADTECSSVLQVPLP